MSFTWRLYKVGKTKNSLGRGGTFLRVGARDVGRGKECYKNKGKKNWMTLQGQVKKSLMVYGYPSRNGKKKG